jgi:DNA helicase II / ATP-dependent DNA helicase PcrA
MSKRSYDTVLTPSAEQQAIINCSSNCLIVEANAGAAKTTTLALKAKSLLEKTSSRGKILFLVFTQPAKRAAIGALVRAGVSPAQIQQIDVLTFDEFSQKMLRSVEYDVVPFKASAESVAPFVKSAMGELSLANSPGFIERFLKTNRRLKGSMSIDCDRWEEVFNFDDFSINHQIDREILSLHLRYEKRRYNYESDDFDRAVFRAEFDATFDLARTIAEPAPRTSLHEIRSWPRQLHALLVDEMHDMNFGMFTIVKALLQTTAAHFCGVGDRDQVIFSSHGAEERFMSRHTDYGDREIASLPLTTCYRFGEPVAMAASGLAGDKKYTVQAGLATKLSREFYTDFGESDCSALAMTAISHWKRQNSYDASNIAVLLRHSWQSVEIENALIEAKIFYETHGFESYLVQPEVLLIRALHAIGTRDYSKLGTRALRERMIETLVFFFGIELSHNESEKESFEEKMLIAKRAALEDGDMGLFIEHVLLKNCSEKIGRRVSGAISSFKSRASHGNPPKNPSVVKVEISMKEFLHEKEQVHR